MYGARDFSSMYVALYFQFESSNLDLVPLLAHSRYISIKM